jgi:hypothetical protein
MWPMLWSLLVTAGTAPPPPTAGCAQSTVLLDEVEAHLQQAAPIEDPRWRMRLGALAPQLTLGGHGSRDQALRSKKVPGSPEVVDDDDATNQKVEAQLRWELSELVFHSRELEVERNQQRAQQQRADRAIRLIDAASKHDEARASCLAATTVEDVNTHRREMKRQALVVLALSDGAIGPRGTTPQDWDP